MNGAFRPLGVPSGSEARLLCRGNEGRGFILRDRLSRHVPFLRLLIAAVFGMTVGACGDDEAISPKPVGSSRITMMHAGFATEGEVEFRRDTATLGRLPYGGIDSALIPNTSTIVTVRSPGGAQLASASVQPDSTVSAWVIFSGTSQQRDAYQIRSTKIIPDTGSVGVRIVHASPDAPSLRVALNAVNGTPVTSANLAYRTHSSYVSLPVVSTSSLVVGRDTATAVMTIPVNGAFQAGSLYTVVLYGSIAPTAGLTYRIVRDR